ncbi:peptidyl-tRNA hydrolase [Maioricimonas rarisocia]|uniref:peptidyl-tRNA hydrolase n=1 Tax=Maioricimonas rarisocia TaxID=2528026 RepID=A0A517Z915_9PLAN|nr:aminoacyl-tRNA hydrolase [Maioricimonas rarisocia]QDU38980.1 peptidyl-tRNA hydrolase [Maioricimonas rarisocia]
MTSEWTRPDHVANYLAMKDDVPHRAAGEETLLAEVPSSSRRILDLGCGDGHLLAMMLAHCPEATGVGLDMSPAMLERARQLFAGNDRVTLVQHNMDSPLPDLGTFDGIVSSFAIHHCEHHRKRELYAEIFDRLQPGGVFCNLEHVDSATPAIHDRFLEAMKGTNDVEDPSNRLLDVETQLRWFREIGFEDVDCHWKWRELALLSGRRPTAPAPEPAPQRIKQVIVMRHDLKMRRGKQIAQGAHASMSFLSRRLQREGTIQLNDLTESQRAWINGAFAKICCRVDSEEELLEIHDRAVEAGLEVQLITDSGRTEFHGQPTRTCLAIGPAPADEIDAVTGHLQLL